MRRLWKDWIARLAKAWGGARSRVRRERQVRLSVEGMEERALLSAAPLPALSPAHTRVDEVSHQALAAGQTVGKSADAGLLEGGQTGAAPRGIIICKSAASRLEF